MLECKSVVDGECVNKVMIQFHSNNYNYVQYVVLKVCEIQ